jgi:syntaxin 5
MRTMATALHGAEAEKHDESLELVEMTQHKNTSIESIEKTLVDIAALFKRFSNIVQSHEELVVRIDTNAEEALYDIEGAKTELRELYENTSSNRALMLKIFFILVVFITFYIIFVL